MAARILPLTAELLRYAAKHGSRETAVQKRLRAETDKLPMAQMQIGADQGAFMQLLIRLMGARRCIEIGTFTGYSALSVAMALPPNGRLVCCDVSEAWTAIARRYWKMAKTHVRHMVGGRAPFARNELLYRFEFPERPGALLRFLDSMRSDWNISLFHYRNQGADYGRVLVGMQVPRQELNQFRTFLKKLGYPYADETRNPAYKLFLV